MSAAFKKISPAASAAVPLRDASSAGAPARALGARRRPVEATSYAQTLVPRVLLVEPNESSRSVMQVALTRDGFEVIAVGSAEEALRQLALGPAPAALVAEAELPALDGFRLCAQLRADQSTAHLPVILLSRRAEEKNTELAGGSGADDYLPKPIFARDVVSLVRLKTSPRAVDGTIHARTDGLPLAHLLRALLAGVRSGRIDLAGGQASISFRQGRVIDAVFGAFRGPDALMRALLLAEGDYTVHLGPSLTRATMSFGLRELVCNAFPRILRWQALVARSVPVGARLTVDFSQLAASLADLPDGVNDIVRLFDGRRTVRDVLIETGLSEVLALEVVTRLYAMGVIAPVFDPEASCEAAGMQAVPRLFEPAPLEADERMAELFGAEPVAAPAESPRAAADRAQGLGDGVDRSFFGESLAEYEAFERWLSPEEKQGLAPEVSRQLDAFRIRPVIEPLDSRPPPLELSLGELTSFARGEAAPEDESLVLALQQPILLTQVFEPAPIPLTKVVENVEARFFSDAPMVPTLGAAVAEAPSVSPWGVPAPGKGKTVDALAILVAVALLSGGAGVVAWRIGSNRADGAAELEAPRSPSSIVAPKSPTVAAAVLKPLSLEPVPAVDEGIALYDAGKPQEASELLLRLVDAEPANVQGWLFLGLARFDSGDSFGAEDAAMQTLELDPKNGRAIILLASVYLVQGERAKAMVELRRYLEVEPQGTYAADARVLLSSH